jgi:hypothetical protein
MSEVTDGCACTRFQLSASRPRKCACICCRYPLDATDAGRALVFHWEVPEDGRDEGEDADAVNAHAPRIATTAAEAPEKSTVWLELKLPRYKLDSSPLLAGCCCYACQNHTRCVSLHHASSALHGTPHPPPAPERSYSHSAPSRHHMACMVVLHAYTAGTARPRSALRMHATCGRCGGCVQRVHTPPAGHARAPGQHAAERAQLAPHAALCGGRTCGSDRGTPGRTAGGAAAPRRAAAPSSHRIVHCRRRRPCCRRAAPRHH